MTVLTIILSLCLLACLGVIYDQHVTIKHQRRLLLDALEWVEPADLVKGDWDED